MFVTTLKQSSDKHMMALASLRLCAGYWVEFTGSNEQDPIKKASFYKGFGIH